MRGERNSMIVDQADRKYHSLLLEKEGLSYSTSTPLVREPAAMLLLRILYIYPPAIYNVIHM